MEVGEPDFATADPILEAAQRFLSGGHVHYTAALGLRALREAISGFYRTRYGLDISPDRIVITAGASAPEVIVERVVDRICKLTNAEVKQLIRVEEAVSFPLPKGLSR